MLIALTASFGSVPRQRRTLEAPTRSGRPKLAQLTTAAVQNAVYTTRRAVLLGISLTAAALLASRHVLRGIGAWYCC